jgi:hypothetical protein
MRPAVYASSETWYNWPDQHGKRHKPAGPDRIRAGKHAAARTPGWKRILENGVLAASIGRILSVILGIYGIVAVALITSIIVNYYGEMKKADPDRPDQQKES